MHVLHLPPRHLWRSAALAALLTLAFMALLTATTQQSTDRSSQVQTPQTQIVVPQGAPPAVLRVPDSSPLEPLAVPRPLLAASSG
jgi:hypothetical protein